MTAARTLRDGDVEAVALRVVEMIEERRLEPSASMLTAGEVAARYGVSKNYIYEHAIRLGAIRLGDGPRARMRFSADAVAEALACETPTPRVAPRSPRRRPTRPQAGDAPLLPIKGRPARKADQ